MSASAARKGKYVPRSDSSSNSGIAPGPAADSSNDGSPFVDVSDGVIDIRRVPEKNRPAHEPQISSYDASPRRRPRPLADLICARSAEYLASLSYTSTGDLANIGLTSSDWPALLDWLADKTSSDNARKAEYASGLNGVECFLLASKH